MDTYRRYNLLRLVLIFGAAVVEFQSPRPPDADAPELLGFLGLTSAMLVLVLAAGSFASGRGASRGFVLFQLLLDAVFTFGLCLLSGSVYSPAQLIYVFSIGVAGEMLGLQGALVVAGTSILFTVTQRLLQADAPELPDPSVVAFTETGFRSFAFLLTAWLAGNLGQSLQKVRREGEMLASQHELVLETVRAAVLTTNPAGVIVTANPAAEALLGRTLGRPLVEVLPGAARILGESGTWEEGGTSDRHWICSLAVLPGGGRVAVVEDTTELFRVRDQAQRVEQEALVGRWAAGVAHEIRNPLSSLSGSLQIIAEDHPSRLTSLALSEVERLNRLVDDFLASARPVAVSRRRVEVRRLADEVAEAFAVDGRYRGRVAVRCEGEPVEADVDPDGVKQILWNLLLNGAQAMPRGGEIQVRVQPADRNRVPGVELRVRDSGLGIAPADIEHIFDPMHTRRAGGTGLGLAMVARVAQAHGGDVRAENVPEGGAELTLWLPRESVHVQ